MRVFFGMTAFSPLDPLAKTRVAILIDADNIAPSFRKEAESAGARLGSVVSIRIFGNIALHRDWAAETGCAVQHCSSVSGKNAADIELVISALDLAYRKLAQSFLIVSNDRDFQPLIRHLRELGHDAQCIKPAPPPATPTATASPAVTDQAKVTAKAMQQALDRLKAFVRKSTQGETGPDLREIGSFMGKVRQTTGKPTWRSFVKSHPAVFILHGDRVRLR